MPAAEEPGPGLRGEVVYLYAFDVANEIRLDRAAELLSGQSAPFTTRQDRPAPRDVPVYRPLAVEPRTEARFQGSPLRVLVRVYEVGVVSVTVRVAFARKSPAELIPFHAPVLDDGRALDGLAREQCAKIRERLAESLVRPGGETDPEAYTLFCLTQLAGERDANRWLAGHQREVAG